MREADRTLRRLSVRRKAAGMRYDGVEAETRGRRRMLRREPGSTRRR